MLCPCCVQAYQIRCFHSAQAQYASSEYLDLHEQSDLLELVGAQTEQSVDTVAEVKSVLSPTEYNPQFVVDWGEFRVQ